MIHSNYTRDRSCVDDQTSIDSAEGRVLVLKGERGETFDAWAFGGLAWQRGWDLEPQALNAYVKHQSKVRSTYGVVNYLFLPERFSSEGYCLIHPIRWFNIC